MIEQIAAFFTIEMIYLWLNIGVIPFWLILIIFPQSKICGLLVTSVFPFFVLTAVLSFFVSIYLYTGSLNILFNASHFVLPLVFLLFSRISILFVVSSKNFLVASSLNFSMDFLSLSSRFLTL